MRILIFLTLLILPTVAFAAQDGFFGPIVPKCAYTKDAICGACDLITLITNVLRFLVAFSVVVATAMFAYAGFLYVTAASNPKNLDSAKGIFSSVFIGLVFVLSAYIIVNLVIDTFTGKSLGEWTKIECVAYPITERTVVSPDVLPYVEDDPFFEDGGVVMSDAEARAYAAELGLTVSSGVSTMEGTAKQTLDNAKALQDACGCVVVITSTTGGTHATRGSCTHGGGCKFDARSHSEGQALVKWIENNLTPIAPRSNGDVQYRDRCGNVYAIETHTTEPHIDVSAAIPCEASLIKTRG